MGYFGFMGMNNMGPYGPMGGGMPPSGGPNGSMREMGIDPTECYKDSFCGSSAEPEKPPKTGIVGFLNGLKNGLVNSVKGLFTVNGLLLTAGTMGLVAATGGAALIPLGLLGLGVGGYQVAKGVKNQNAEQVGEGVFTGAASLLGLRAAPGAVGAESLANPSLWGKIKAPFVGKGAFTNPEATYWGATKASSTASLTRMKEGLMGRPAGQTAAGEAIEAKVGAFEKFNNSFKNQNHRDNLKRLATGSPPNPTSPSPNQQGQNPGNPAPLSQRVSEGARRYYDKLKQSPQTVSAYLGTVFSGQAKTTQKEGERRESAPNPDRFYY